jgi:hypothetical protein
VNQPTMPAAAIKTRSAEAVEKRQPGRQRTGQVWLAVQSSHDPLDPRDGRVSRTGTPSLASYLAASCRSTGRTDGSSASDGLSSRAASIVRRCPHALPVSARGRRARASCPAPPAPPNQITARLLPIGVTPLRSTNGCIVAAATRESQPAHVVKLAALQIEVLEQSQACLHELSESHDSDGTDVFIYCNYLISPPSCIP